MKRVLFGMTLEHLKSHKGDIIMFEIKLSEEDLKVLDSALVQLPYYQVVELIGKINAQIEQSQYEESDEVLKNG